MVRPKLPNQIQALGLTENNGVEMLTLY